GGKSAVLKREADIAIGLSGPEHMRLVSRRLTDYRMYVYGSLAYLDKATPIVTVQDLKNHPFIGYVEELLFAPELSFAEAIGADIEPRIRSTSVLAQLHATLSGGGLCVLPAFAASRPMWRTPAIVFSTPVAGNSATASLALREARVRWHGAGGGLTAF